MSTTSITKLRRAIMDLEEARQPHDNAALRQAVELSAQWLNNIADPTLRASQAQKIGRLVVNAYAHSAGRR